MTAPVIDVHLDADDWQVRRAQRARRTLAADPPFVDPVWFYDEHGSRLFDAITRLPEYYPTRTEPMNCRMTPSPPDRVTAPE